MAPALAGAAAIVMSLGLLLRQLWFDEALTILEFMSHPLHKIYLCYDIPNNHILFTSALNLWLSFQNLLGQRMGCVHGLLHFISLRYCVRPASIRRP